MDLANGQKQEFKAGYSVSNVKKGKGEEIHVKFMKRAPREPTRVGPIGCVPKKGI